MACENNKAMKCPCTYSFHMKKKIFIVCILAVSIPLILTGCIPGDGTYTPDKPAGFFLGDLARLDCADFACDRNIQGEYKSI